MKKTKYIFITGGVLSSLGKGIAAASIGNILESYGFKITIIKFDPYLNVDPGTMSPFQHGEVFVTDDGAETDLDLGHYERFTQAKMSQMNNWTAGRIYHNIIQKERRGDYLGKTVQVIPQVTDEINNAIQAMDGQYDFIISEIGGTVGDIESLPFLESIRQIGLLKDQENVIYIHLTLVPFIKTAGELKTKPTQHSVKALREIGIQPDILLCRSEIPIPPEIKKKIALFTNVKEQDVVSAFDVDSIYEIPIIFKKQGLGESLLRKLNLKKKMDDSRKWESWLRKAKKAKKEIRIGIVGKYIKLYDSYKSLFEALYHAGVENNVQVQLDLIESETLVNGDHERIFQYSGGILVPGGFGIRGIEGMVKAVEFARTRNMPYFGICLGMQTATIEFMRNVVGLTEAHSTEFKPSVSHKIFVKLKELKNVEEMGHNMRLGEFSCQLKKNTRASRIYRAEKIFERHRHRYEFNPQFEAMMIEGGMVVSGKNIKRNLVEIIELPNHPWFIGCQFHPEFKSGPLKAHPLFVAFIRAAKEFSEKKERS